MKKKSSLRLTRLELADALAVGLTSIDRLIGRGLRTVGHRGLAKVYRLAAARRLLEKLSPSESTASDVLLADYRCHAEDLHDRLETLRAEWVPDATWLPAWRRVVAAVSKLTATWPGQLGVRIGDPSADAGLLLWADGPRPVPPPPARAVTAAELRVLLAGDPAAYLWRPAATKGIQTLAGRGLGIAIREDGTWSAWDPAQTPRLPAPAEPPPLVRPLLQALAITIARHTRPLAARLARPAAEPLPNPPADVDEARMQWRAARSSYRRQRVAIRRGYRRRVEVVAAIGAAVAQFKAYWWSQRADFAHLAGDGAAAIRAAERVRVQSVATLRSLGGLVPPAAPERTPRTQRRRTRPARKGRHL